MILITAILINTSAAAFLLQLAGVFMFIVACILLFIAYYLQKKRRLAKTKKHLRRIYSDLISEISLCENEEEREAVLVQPYIQSIISKWLAQKAARKVLLQELVKSKDSLTGDAAENLRWLYEKLKLNEDSFQRFSSKRWHVKASGIQQLAEMHQAQYLVKIYRETNSKNRFIRTEAQIAVVKLTGFKGLRFLHIVSHPVTQWQQLALLDQLKEQDIVQQEISRWLQSANDTVVEFALRLVEVYKCFELHDEVVNCLQHASVTVRLQALRSIKEIATDNSFNWLWPHFSRCSRQEKLLLVEVIASLSTTESYRFLQSLLPVSEEAVRHKITTCLAETSPSYTKDVASDSTPLTYLLSPVQKQVV